MDEAIKERLAALLEELIPDDTKALSVGDVTKILRRLREFFELEEVPDEVQASYAAVLVPQILQRLLADIDPNADAAAVKREWSDAIGFDIGFIN